MAITSDTISLLFKAKGDTDEAKKAFNELATTFGLSESSAKNLGVALPIVGAAVTAVTAAVLGASAAIFQLTKNASEFGSEIFDATEKTGLAAETISAMKMAADQSGTSLEAVTAASSKFARTIGDAALGSEKAQAKLDRLGVTSQDLDTALGQALGTIAKLPPGIAQMTAAQDAFGKSGVELLPFIKSFDGDLAALTQRAKDLGVTITDDAARKADQFGDTLDTVSAQAAGLGRAFAFELMPMITDALQSTSDFLARNKGVASEWGAELARVLKNVTGGFDVLGDAAKLNLQALTLGFIDSKNASISWAKVTSESVLLVIGPLVQLVSELGKVKKAYNEAFSGPESMDSGPLKYANNGGLPGTAPEPYKGQWSKEGQKKFSDWQYDQEQKKQAELKRLADQAAKDRRIERDRELNALQDNIKLRIKAETDQFDKIQDEWETAFIEKRETEETWRTESEKNFAVYAAKVKKMLLDAFKLDAIGKTPTEIANLRLGKDSANTTVDNFIIKSRADREKTITGIIEKETDQREKDDKEWWAYLKESLDREGDDYIAKTKEFVDQVVKDAAFLASLPSVPLEAPQMSTEGSGDKPDSAFQTFLNTFAEGIGKYLEGVALIRNANGELEFSMKQVFTSLAEMGINAFGQLAAGFGQLVSNWVLYGNAGEQGLRKMTASILANVAQTAATYALMCLAAAALATTVWGAALLGGTPAQFLQGAAIFGAVAVGAAVAGRATAGDSFKKASSGNFGTASSSGNRSGNGGSVYSSQEDGVVETSRNNPGGRGVLSQLRSEITLKIESTSAHIVEVVKSNINNNGQLRTAIQDATG